MALKNMAASVLARLKNQSKAEGQSFQIILQLFAQEEFLRKLSRSNYVDNMILKGGMFIYTLTEFDSRPTRDIDFLIRNLQGSLENIEQAMKDLRKKKAVSILGAPVRWQVRLVKHLPVDLIMNIWCKQQGK